MAAKHKGKTKQIRTNKSLNLLFMSFFYITLKYMQNESKNVLKNVESTED